MDWNAQTLQFLSTTFLNTLSPIATVRRAAEQSLLSASSTPNYALAVLRLVAEPSVDPHVRKSAAVYFKNHLKGHWGGGNNNNDDAVHVLSPQEKELIKNLVVPVMLTSEPGIQVLISEALAVIAEQDFPNGWPALLPDLKARLEVAVGGNDYVSAKGILVTLNSLFKKFRYQFKTDALLTDLKYCVDTFAVCFLSVFESIGVKIRMASERGDAGMLRQVIDCQRLCCRIFYSLVFVDLPEFFEDSLDRWMSEFKYYLTVPYPIIENNDDGVSFVDGLRAAVCDAISHFMEKEEEVFQKYLGEFVGAVWSVLMAASASPSRERLTVTAIKFLTTVSTSVHHSLFASDNDLQNICSSIVIPNVMLRDEDEELFEMNYVEFIRRDMEGSDLDTRRRISCELLKGIGSNYKEKIDAIVKAQLQNCLASFAENPAANWKYKDCAIYLVISLATKKAGGSSISTDLIDVGSFFESAIVPELRSQDVNALPLLKAGALKFFTMFRSQIPKPIALALLPDVIRFIKSDSNVVHSYASSCIEKLLLVKDDGGRARYLSSDIGPVLVDLITNLFAALEMPESEENQYVMKCIMRVLGVADVTRELASFCVVGLTSVLNRVCENPKNPVFNHYLFEALAVLVKRACEKDRSLVPAFEDRMLPSIQIILFNDVTEFLPYAFQLLAQLVDLNSSPIPLRYMEIFKILLMPESWERSAGNVPALVRLLKSFLQKAPHELNREGRLQNVLEIFSKLVLSRSTVDQGFYVLNTVVENLEYEVISGYMTHIWAGLFRLLQDKQKRTVKFLKSLVIFMSLFLIKHGPQKLIDSVNAVQADIFPAILDQFWIPNLKLITGSIETKLTAVAATRLICESPLLLDPLASAMWSKMLDSIVTLLSRPEEDRVEEELEVPDFGVTVGYNASFVQLYNAGKSEEDPLKDIKDPKQFLLASLVNLSARSPGRFPQVINEIEPSNQAALRQLCSSYNLSIV